MISKTQTLKAQFPSTRYQGSKRKILPWIHDCLKEYNFHTVLDGLGGSGMVSYMFKKMGKKVIFNDELTFNSVVATSFIENNDVKLSEKRVAWLLAKHSYVNYKSVVFDNFKDIYYLPDENIMIDRIVCNINNLKGPKEVVQYQKAIAFYALFQSCLIKRPFNLFHRKNLNLRLNKVPRSFGNHKTWNRTFEYYMHKFVKEINEYIFDSGTDCLVKNESIFDLNVTADLVYLDPPYFRQNSTNETSNYFGCYHFLEGLLNYNKWESMIDQNSKNNRLKPDDSYESFSKLNASSKYFELISKFKNSIIVFSYKKGGIPSIDEIEGMMISVGKKVIKEEIKYSYALNSQNGNAKHNREFLIIGI